MPDFLSVISALENWAVRDGSRVAYRYHDDKQFTEGVTYAELAQYIENLAFGLRSNLLPGDRVGILLSDCTAYILCFFAALKAGLIPVTLPRPIFIPGKTEKKADRSAHAIRDCMPAMLIVEPDDRERITNVGVSPDVICRTFNELVALEKSPIELPILHGNDIAFLQYTSGSTSNPKGVMVTHRNLRANHLAIAELTQISDQAVSVSWLPLSHDMGMMGKIINNAFMGGTCHLIRPETFVRSPTTWLKLISDYRAIGTAAPNFALDHCVKRVKPEKVADLDLSSLKILLNGSEDIRAQSLIKFAAKFQPFGFDPNAYCPVYGLAEATLLVSGSAPGRPHTVVRGEELVRGDATKSDDQFIPAQAEYVSCGQTCSDHQVRIVDPHTRMEMAAGGVGEIWFGGPSVTAGYWRDPEKTRITFDDSTFNDGFGPYLRTGDFGFFFRGSLFISGRLKDVIIYNGKNYYPSDIERIVAAANPILDGYSSAAISVATDGGTRLVLLQEIHPRDMSDETLILEIKNQISRAVSQQIHIPIEGVYMLPRGTLPLTTSGKVSRKKCQSLYLEKYNNLEKEEIFKYDDKVEIFEQKKIRSLIDIRDWIVNWISENKEMPVCDIGYSTPFAELGLDSIDAVTVVDNFNNKFNATIDVIAMFSFPTIDELAPHLLKELKGAK